MQTSNLKHIGSVSGPQTRKVWIKFTPNGTGVPTVEESHGCNLVVTRTSAGIYVVTLAANAIKAMAVECLGCVPGDTNFHELTHAESVSGKTVTITHRTISYATIVSSGPAVSDTCGQITLVVLCREQS